MTRRVPQIIAPLGVPIATSTVTYPVQGVTRQVLAITFPVFTVAPSITSDGTPEVGEVLTGNDGTVISGTVSARQWRRGSTDISGATGSTYTLVEADVGQTITFRVTATGSGGDTTATSAGVGPVTGFPLPAFSTAKYDGDSRTQEAGSRVNSSGSLTITTGTTPGGGAALIQPLAGNKWLLAEGYQHAIGGSTTLAQDERRKTTSIASTGNPAFDDTGNTIDQKFSDLSDGVSTILTQAGDHIFSTSVGVNDNSGSAAAFYNSPATASQTLATIARIADAIGAVDKIWYVGNECPRGDAFYSMESRSVSGGTCTAANTTNFRDGESFGAVGCIGVFASGLPRALTKVASAPGQDEYTVTSGGLFTFGGTAPTSVFLNYNASPSGGRTATYDQLRIINEFMESSAANFVSTINSVDYGIPGLRYQRPWVRIVNTWGALLDDTSGSAQLPIPGVFDSLQLHTRGYGTYLLGKAFADAVAADYPAAPDLSTAPTRNNWWAARGTNVGTSFSGTLPPTMRTGSGNLLTAAVPTLLSINGAVIGAVNTSTGAITGPNIVSGSLDFATGAWTLELNSSSLMPANAQLWFEQDIGNGALVFSSGVFASWTEGTIGRNAVMNGLLDLFTAVGTGLLAFNGASTITSIASTDVPYGYSLTGTALDAAIVAGTATAAIVSGTDADGYPIYQINCRGIHTAAAVPSLGSGTLNNFASRVTAGDKLLAGGVMRYGRDGTEGVTYGNNGSSISGSFGTASVARSSPTGNQNVTQVLARVHDQGSSIYFDDQVAEAEGGFFHAYRCSPTVDTTGMTFSSPQIIAVMGRGVANVPFAFRMGVGRLQFRRRNDVA